MNAIIQEQGVSVEIVPNRTNLQQENVKPN